MTDEYLTSYYNSNYDSTIIDYQSSNNIEINEIVNFRDKDYNTLVTSIIQDTDFIKAYKCLNKNLIDFVSSNEKEKIEILIKCFFTLKYEKDLISTTSDKLKEKINQIKENNEKYIKEKIEKYNKENYYLKCELEVMRNKLDNVKSRKEEIEKLYEEILSKYENSKEKIKEKENLYFKVFIEKNELEKKFEGIIFKLKNDYSHIKQKNEEYEKENILLKSDVEMARIKNEEYIINIADLMSSYQEVCDRNKLLEKLSKHCKDLEDEFNSQKSNRNHLENFLTSGNENEEKLSTPEQYTVNMKVNINKLNQKEKKLNKFINNTTKKQIVTKELEIGEDDNKQVLSYNYSYELNNDTKLNYINYNNNYNNVLLTNTSFVSDYNSEKFYDETFKTEEMRNDANETGNNDKFKSSIKEINPVNNNSHKSTKRYSDNTNNSHNSSVSIYESHFESKFQNDDYDSNAFQCIKNIDNISSNNTDNNTNQTKSKHVNIERGGVKRRYDYDSNCFDDKDN